MASEFGALFGNDDFLLLLSRQVLRASEVRSLRYTGDQSAGRLASVSRATRRHMQPLLASRKPIALRQRNARRMGCEMGLHTSLICSLAKEPLYLAWVHVSLAGRLVLHERSLSPNAPYDQRITTITPVFYEETGAPRRTSMGRIFQLVRKRAWGADRGPASETMDGLWDTRGVFREAHLIWRAYTCLDDVEDFLINYTILGNASHAERLRERPQLVTHIPSTPLYVRSRNFRIELVQPALWDDETDDAPDP